MATAKAEARLGLQQINFGPGIMLRPLQWFDRLDPRDPLSLSRGQWGLVSKIFYSDGANAWLWGLYGNRDPRQWESEGTYGRRPEFGGRWEWTLPRGEMALSAHRRWVEIPETQTIKPEPRLGLEGNWDLGLGLWGEACWMGRRAADSFSHRKILMAGADYTLSLGQGIHLAGEHLVFSDGAHFNEFTETRQLSAISVASHPGLLDDLKLIGYYDWRSSQPYFFMDWGRGMKWLTLHLSAFWGPKDQGPSEDGQYLGSRGVGLTAIYAH